MIRFAPAVGLLLASPVVLSALQGRRSVDDALLALLVGLVVAAAGMALLSMATRVSPPAPTAEDDDPESRERR